ncbi:MAG: transporter [Muribaculaceae bacterium]|nr:transporter [Muribaculaceae bacterium]
MDTRRLKPWMMPIAMVIGALFHRHIVLFQPLVPYFIFTMLLIAFCKAEPREFRITRLSWSLLSIQLGGAVLVYLALRGVGVDLAQAAFICVLCPTATAAPVVTGMLGGNVARLATYSIVSNIAAAVSAPAFFAVIGTHSEMSFLDGVLTIAIKVAPLILLPLLLAFSFYFFAPKLHKAIARYQSLSFYLWSVSLVVAVGGAVSYVMSADASKVPEIIAIALVAALMCVLQFAIGRRIGRACGDRIAGAQGLGQKNTILAIWMALTYLNPISSVGPAAYIVWQNTINSVQLYIAARKQSGPSER